MTSIAALRQEAGRLWSTGSPPAAGPLTREGLARRIWPFAVAAFAAGVLLTLPQTQISEWAVLYAAAGLTAGLVLAALFVPWHRIPFGVQVVVPMGFLAVIALLRDGTGGSAGYAVLVMLPVLWLALYGTRWQLIVALVLTACVFVLPILVVGAPRYPPSQLGRIILWPVIAAIVGGTTYRLVAVERARTAFVNGLLSSATQQSIIATDKEGVITAFNTGAERLFGYSAGEMVGAATTVALHDPDEVRARAAELGVEPGFKVFTAQAGKGESDTRVWTYITRDGRRIQLSLSVTPIYDDTGSLTGFVKVGTDVTARLAAERLKDDFVSSVSHELRTPLSSIIGYLEVLFDEEDTGSLTPRQRRFLEVVDRNARRQLRLVSDLLFVSQVEAGRVRLDVGDVDIAEIAVASVEVAEPRAKAGEVSLGLHLDGPVRMRGDADRLGQVIDNLLTNAVKFTPPGGRVDVLVSSTADAAVVEVTDTGIGIPAAEQERLFTRFFRASTATSRAIPGVGLGLTIVRAIVEEHHGATSLVSADGAGTTFRVEMPLAFDRATVTVAPEG